MSKTVYCDKCLQEIKYRADLVTTTIMMEVVPYNEDCYAKDLKGAKTLFVNNQPINGFSGTFLTIVFVILGIMWFVVAEGNLKWPALLVLIPIGYRLYSYFTFERYTEK